LNDASPSQESDLRTLFTVLKAVINYAVELGKLIFQQHMIMAGPRNVPRAACTGFNAIERLLRGFEHRRRPCRDNRLNTRQSPIL
jgi:hypothetical protein